MRDRRAMARHHGSVSGPTILTNEGFREGTTPPMTM